jgi:DNA-binding NarL/FixJ family response regulator
MRVILVGPSAIRARLRAQMNGSANVVGEFASLASARAAKLDADAFVLATGSSEDEEAAVETLTAREIQVLELLVEGRSNKAIAGELGISDQTVKFHVAAIAGKLGAANRTDAVRRAIRRGIVTV